MIGAVPTIDAMAMFPTPAMTVAALTLAAMMAIPIATLSALTVVLLVAFLTETVIVVAGAVITVVAMAAAASMFDSTEVLVGVGRAPAYHPHRSSVAMG
jgi:hypothetical protein